MSKNTELAQIFSAMRLEQIEREGGSAPTTSAATPFSCRLDAFEISCLESLAILTGSTRSKVAAALIENALPQAINAVLSAEIEDPEQLEIRRSAFFQGVEDRINEGKTNV